MAYHPYNTQTREWSSALGHVWNDNNTASNFPNPLHDVAITGPGNISVEPVGVTNGGFGGSLVESCDGRGNISQLEPVNMTNGGFRGSLVESLCARTRGSVPQLNTTQLYENMQSLPMPTPDSSLLKIPRGLSPASLLDSPDISKVQRVDFPAASNVQVS